MGLSKSAAAEALGLSRNMPHRYETGKAPVPRYVALACYAIELVLDSDEKWYCDFLSPV